MTSCFSPEKSAMFSQFEDYYPYFYIALQALLKNPCFKKVLYSKFQKKNSQRLENKFEDVILGYNICY